MTFGSYRYCILKVQNSTTCQSLQRPTQNFNWVSLSLSACCLYGSFIVLPGIYNIFKCIDCYTNETQESKHKLKSINGIYAWKIISLQCSPRLVLQRLTMVKIVDDIFQYRRFYGIYLRSNVVFKVFNGVWYTEVHLKVQWC